VSFFAEQCRGSTSAARSCLFVCSSTVVYMGHYERPHFPPKVFLAAPTINVGYRNSNRRHAASHVDWPSRILLTVRPARQVAFYLRRMTTTALEMSETGEDSIFTHWDSDGRHQTARRRGRGEGKPMRGKGRAVGDRWVRGGDE